MLLMIVANVHEDREGHKEGTRLRLDLGWKVLRHSNVMQMLFIPVFQHSFVFCLSNSTTNRTVVCSGSGLFAWGFKLWIGVKLCVAHTLTFTCQVI